MTTPKAREELIKKLDLLVDEGWSSLTIEQTADFILADRERIVEPLVKLGGIIKQPLPSYEKLCNSIEETLKNAGIS